MKSRGLLQQVTSRYGTGDSVRMAFFRTLNSVNSDGERRHTLSTFLRSSAPVAKIWCKCWNRSLAYRPTGKKASLLVEMTKHYQEDAALRASFFKAMDTLHSAGESRRVLSALLERSWPFLTLLSVLQSAKTISSDGEKATLLVQMAKDCVGNSELLATFLEVSNSLGSDGEYRRVLSTVFEDTNFLKKIALQSKNSRPNPVASAPSPRL